MRALESLAQCLERVTALCTPLWQRCPLTKLRDLSPALDELRLITSQRELAPRIRFARSIRGRGRIVCPGLRRLLLANEFTVWDP